MGEKEHVNAIMDLVLDGITMSGKNVLYDGMNLDHAKELLVRSYQIVRQIRKNQLIKIDTSIEPMQLLDPPLS